MIVLNKKFKKVLYCALIVTVVLTLITTIKHAMDVYGYFMTSSKPEESNRLLSHGFYSMIIASVCRPIIYLFYLVFLFRSLYCLKRDNFFNLRNAYLLVGIAGVELLACLLSVLSAAHTGWMSVPEVILHFFATTAHSAFMMCMALLYLAAVRSEESERLTI